MRANRINPQPRFRPEALSAELRAQRAPIVPTASIEPVDLSEAHGALDDIDGGWARAQKSRRVPKIKEYLTVGRNVRQLSEARKRTAKALRSLGMELCAVEGVDLYVYIHKDEILGRQKLPYVTAASLMAPIQHATRLATEEKRWPQQLSIPFSNLIRTISNDDSAVSKIYVQLDTTNRDFTTMLEERRQLRAKSGYPDTCIATCFLGELVDYEAPHDYNDHDNRWKEAKAVLESNLPPLLATGPVGFVSSRTPLE